MDMERGGSAGEHEAEHGGEKEEEGRWHGVFNDCVLAYKTLGIVFGGLVTSPLYVYPSMNLNSPTKDDYLAIYSIMFWTLTLIGVIKYVCIALSADDHGEGGTFALYSLLCRHADVGILPSREGDVMRSFFEQSLIARRLLLFVAISGVCMLIGDGILTPAISVLSAMDGLRGPLPSVNKSIVEALSAVILVLLFMLQKHGTSRVSFLFSPIMAAWTFTTPLIGVYSIVHYEPTVFRALSPHYIVLFFRANGKAGWQLLSGAVLCITGAEAMFADLGHFNKRSIQMAFLFAIYPSLVLTYAGQTAYLINNPGNHGDGFYKFVPRAVYWPMFVVATLAAVVASQSLISATFSVIKQSVVHTSPNKEGEVYSPEVNYILMVLCVAIILTFGDGQDIGNAFGVVVIMVMVITTILLTLVMLIVWRTPLPLVVLFFAIFSSLEAAYVSAVFTKIPEGGGSPSPSPKMQYEMRNKITAADLAALLSSEPHIQRVPGVCFFYSNIQDGLTPVLGHYIKNTRSLHQVTIFTTLRYSLAAKVPQSERVAIRPLGPPGTYSCIIQFGYADPGLEGGELVARVVDKLLRDLPKAAAPPVEAAMQAGVVHVRGKTRFYVGKGTSLYDRIMLGFYEFLHSNCRSALPARGVPLQQRMEVGMLYEA
ncbi:unnamed protein product [Spirodela intermedia]|uniref:Potassium transporter n=1 Tax=Spirodela intermedia TaxID=51605 RepID=A0A7I8J3N3_SPIIN|nr:unnamed protein product [Spirodela intermedia]CAA6664719.1 unnamed protein product [Spirodela intermedia]